MTSSNMLTTVLIMALALKVSAQSSLSFDGSALASATVSTFSVVISEVLTAVSTTTSYRQPSLVPFNSGPDPFPIVLPSTVIRSSSTITTSVTPTLSELPSGSATSDPFTLPQATSDFLDPIPVVTSTPNNQIIPISSALAGLTTNSQISVSVVSISTEPTLTVTAAITSDSTSPSQSEADSVTNAKKLGWQKAEFQACVVLGLVALLVASM